MQLQGATELELKIRKVVERCEAELPASELETTIVTTLSDAGAELQRLRGHWPPGVVRMKSGWLIERHINSVLHFWNGRSFEPQSFVPDPHEGVQFASPQDASRVLAWPLAGIGRVAEHVFEKVPGPPGPPDVPGADRPQFG
jgi:hypothetical protein